MKTIDILFFATIRDHMGTKQISLEIPSDTRVTGLKSQLVALKPEAAPAIENALVSINREYASQDDIIPDGAEVALFPHVSGG